VVQKLFFGGGACGADGAQMPPFFLCAGKIIKKIQGMAVNIGKHKQYPPDQKICPFRFAPFQWREPGVKRRFNVV
jgi:hypothetical protein